VSEMAAKKGVVVQVDVPQEQIGTTSHGELIFKANCTSCHGNDGKKELGGATNLSTSAMSTGDVKTVIAQGRKSMPSFSQLSSEEIELLAVYIRTLQQK